MNLSDYKLLRSGQKRQKGDVYDNGKPIKEFTIGLVQDEDSDCWKAVYRKVKEEAEK